MGKPPDINELTSRFMKESAQLLPAKAQHFELARPADASCIYIRATAHAEAEIFIDHVVQEFG